MNTEDLIYLCRTVGDLSGIPVRVYRGEELLYFHSATGLPRDPVRLYQGELLDIREPVGYLITKQLDNYGVVNAGKVKIIVGPTRQVNSTDQELRELAFQVDVPGQELPAFLAAMKAIVRMPLESVLQMLCTVNFALTGQRLALSEIQITQQDQESLRLLRERQKAEASLQEGEASSQAVHNTLAVEETLMELIRRGDTVALREWLAEAPAVRGGTLAADQLRQRKNTFIVTAALASRAAIRGGMDPDEALSLSDRYIQNCELLAWPDQIANLQYHMVLEFAERVESVRQYPTKLAAAVAGYIQRHLSKPITAEAMAEELFMSRPYLSRRFKQDTGESLSAFVLRTKTEEAKRLLRYTDKPIGAISDYLGFSSHGHFVRVFKRIAGVTPGEYRSKGSKAG